jgi:hypothetical protein
MKAINLKPPFWFSGEYIRKANLEWVSDGRLIGVADSAGWFFVPFDSKEKQFSFESDFWCGFVGLHLSNSVLDRQYIYDPTRFFSMNGGCWETFRKNSSKVERRSNSQFRYERIRPNEYLEEISSMLEKWSEGKEIYDPETVIRFSLFGQNRWGWFRDNQLIGFNVADRNWYYTNYRLCIDNCEPFVQEGLRLKFYQNLDWFSPADGVPALVNDGGDLDNPALASFKLKLNPEAVFNVCTNRKEIDDGNQ